ncbi:MAG: carbohydrate kinase family protein [Anaerolineae bacterium]
MPTILIIGGVSRDILHIGGRAIASAGGAGLYTSMAAHRSGAKVSLFAPRPDPVPKMFQPVAQRLAAWLGPEVSPGALPRFEIARQGAQATYRQASFGAEAYLAPENLPPDLSSYDSVHIVPLGDVGRQLAFLGACRQRGARLISAGTYLDAVLGDPAAVGAVMEQGDVFFMNEEEAVGLFGSVEAAVTRPGKFLYVTLGEQGALVVQGSFATKIAAVPCKALDPTGAGDAFCGATLAHLAQGKHPIMAARLAMPLAAEMTEYVGPAALFWRETAPGLRLDERVVVNGSQVQRVARLVAGLDEVAPFDFTGPHLPPVGHPAAVDYFFAATLHQFSFWTTDQGRYHLPLIAPIDGEMLKGSDYLWKASMRPLDEDREFYLPERQATLTREDLLTLYRADDDSDPMPALDLHLEQARQYGRDMLALNLTPAELIRRAQSSPSPLATFERLLDHVGGYKEDPLRKKPELLAVILNQRPEAFLTFGPQEQSAPVIDYHLMRACLRIGLVEVVDGRLRQDLAERRVLAPADEAAVRDAAYQAVDQVAAGSGKSAGAVDSFLFFNSRKRCPEMTEPRCGVCPVDPLCAHRKELFQPVIRTTFY